MTWFNFLALVISTRDSWIDFDDDLYPMIAKTRSFYRCLLEKGYFNIKVTLAEMSLQIGKVENVMFS